MVPAEYQKMRNQWLNSKEAASQLKNYIPEKNKHKDELKELRKEKNRTPKHIRMKKGK